MITLIATLVAAVSCSEEKAAALPIVQYASPYGYGVPGVPYLGSGPLAYPVASPVAPVATAAPLTYAPTLVGAHAAVAPVPAAPLALQHHAQDEFGNLAYGYVDNNSAKHESGNGAIGVTGSCQYVDPAGKLQTVQYVADALGFRVADSRLPVAPVYDGVAPVAPVYDGVAPAPVEKTPEVLAAEAEHLAAFEKIAAEHSISKRESDPQVVYGYNSLAYDYAAGYYTPSLAYYDFRYPYVAGYGPRAFTFGYRHPKKKISFVCNLKKNLNVFGDIVQKNLIFLVWQKMRQKKTYFMVCDENRR